MKTVLKLVKVARSTYYYWRRLKSKRKDSDGNSRRKRLPGYSLHETGKRIKDEEIVLIIRDVISGECSCYGYKKVTAHLMLQCKIKINKKKYTG